MNDRKQRVDVDDREATESAASARLCFCVVVDSLNPPKK
jgi:hypothetical protein